MAVPWLSHGPLCVPCLKMAEMGGTDELAKLLPRQRPNGPTRPASPMTRMTPVQSSRTLVFRWQTPVMRTIIFFISLCGIFCSAGRVLSLAMPDLWRVEGMKRQVAASVMHHDSRRARAWLAPQLTARTGMQANGQGRAGHLRGLGSDLGLATTTILLRAHVVAVLSRIERVEKSWKKIKKIEYRGVAFFKRESEISR